MAVPMPVMLFAVSYRLGAGGLHAAIVAVSVANHWSLVFSGWSLANTSGEQHA
jgi:hypothetical protein